MWLNEPLPPILQYLFQHLFTECCKGTFYKLMIFFTNGDLNAALKLILNVNFYLTRPCKLLLYFNIVLKWLYRKIILTLCVLQH